MKKVAFARVRALTHTHTLPRAHRVASRHRNLRQLRRLSSPHTVTSGFSVALRGFSRLIYLFTRYIIHTDCKDTHSRTGRPTSAPDEVSISANIRLLEVSAGGCQCGFVLGGRDNVVLFACLTE